MSLVSIVIPSYNHAHYIARAVESVLVQTHSELELIIVDDGSTDNSLEYLRGLQDPRVRLIEQPNAGAHNAINRGLEMARGSHLGILNSDDIYHPTRLADALAALEKGNADLVATWIEVIDSAGSVLAVKEGWRNMLPWPIEHPERSFAATNSFAKNLLMTNFVSTTSNVLFSRRLYERIGGMRNLRFAHDWDFLLRAARHFRCELIEKPLLQYRIHSTNTISSNRAWMLFEICWVLAIGMMAYEGDVLYGVSDSAAAIADVHAIAESVNAQGNDRVIWMIRQFVDARRKSGDLEPELRLLEDKVLRDAFIAHVVTDSSSSDSRLPNALPAGLKGIAYRIARRLAKGVA